jgi:hypothetical protein
MLEGVFIVPGKNYRYSTPIHHDLVSQIRLSSSIRFFIQPDPLKTGDISMDLLLRSFALLSTSSSRKPNESSSQSVNILEPFTLNVQAMCVSQELRIHLSNTELGSLETPPAWSVDGPPLHVKLSDGMDLSISLTVTSQIKFNLQVRPLFMFLKEIEQTNKSPNKSAKPQPLPTKQGSLLSFTAVFKVPLISIQFVDAPASISETLCLTESISMRFVSEDEQTSASISAAHFRIFFTDGSTSLPIYNLRKCSSDKPGFHCSIKMMNWNGTKPSIELSVKTGSSYIAIIPSFIKHTGHLFAAIKDGKHMESNRGNEGSINLVEKLRRLGFSFAFSASSNGLHIILPSQDTNSIQNDHESVLNTVCLQWNEVATTLSLITSEAKDIEFLQTISEDNAVVDFNAVSHLAANKGCGSLVLLKAEIDATFCLTRTGYILRAQSEMDCLPTFQAATEQCIVSPFSYSFASSVVMTSNGSRGTIFSSSGFHLDIGAVEILWHVTRSNAGLSDALKLSVLPLFRSDSPKTLPVTPRQDFEALTVTSPIQYTHRYEPGHNEVKLPENIYSMLKDAMFVSSLRISSIQVICVPSNAKEVSSPIVKVNVGTLRLGASVLRCHSSGGIRISTETAHSTTSFIYFALWMDFDLNAHYHNRRLVIWEPLIEAWEGNLQGCLNISEAFDMQPFIEITDADETVDTNIETDSSKLARIIRSIKHMRSKIEEGSHGSMEDDSAPVALSNELDLCHLIQCVSHKHLELSVHPASAHAPLHLKETFIYVPSTTNDHSAVIAISNGKANQSMPNHKNTAGVNITGAFIENVSLVLSERSNESHISPHYICNETGLTMSWKVEGLKSSHPRVILPEEKDELLHIGFPYLRSFISVELYRQSESPCLAVVQKINVDQVGAKRYAIKTQGKDGRSYVVVR